MQSLLTDANIAIGKFDTMGYLAPNLNHIIAMYVRKDLLKNHISPSMMQQAI